jgi:flagellar hook-length control protein FliK
MHFFPAAPTHGAQFSSSSGLFELTDANPGQNFNDLFSAHLNDPQTPAAPPPAQQSQPQSTQSRAFADDSSPEQNHQKSASSAYASSDKQEDSSNSGVAEGAKGEPRADSTEPAKDAGQRQDAAQSEHGEASDKVGSEDELPASEGADAALASDVADEALVVEVRELLEALAADVAQRKGRPDAAGISSRIEALHELLRQFKDASPDGRNELAVALGEQLRGLQKDLAAGARAEAAGELSRKAGSASSVTSISSAGQKIEALLQKLAARMTPEHDGSGPQAARVAAASSAAQSAAAVKNEGGAQPRSAGVSVTTAEMAREADAKIPAHRQGDGAEPAAAAVRRDSRAQDEAARPVLRERQNSDAPRERLEYRAVATENSSEKNSEVSARAESRSWPAEQVQKAADGERTRGAATGQESATRSEAATHTGIAASANRPAAVKDGSAQAMQQGESLRQEGAIGASEKARVADSKGNKNQPDARQGFFGEPDREKASASRTAQAAGKGKNVPESVNQAATQNTQTQFQQRLESPASARSNQVYQQVENGAFRNLGQGVKQLVIRLDPAELGQISVILQMRGKEVQAVLRSSNQDTSIVLSEQLGQLRSQLEAQGLKVGKLEVQTQLADPQSQSQWQGAESHNRYQENQELAMSARRWRSLDRVAPDLARDVQNSPHRENVSQSGLDIFA